jgi:peptide/nickel transport system ATP-binding protein
MSIDHAHPAEARPDTGALLSVRNLSKTFGGEGGPLRRLANRLGIVDAPLKLRAVTDVSFDVHRGEVVGLVGESGCGKSTLGRIIAGVTDQSAGEMVFTGQSPAARGRSPALSRTLSIQMVFQNPYASLDPRQRVGDAIGEAVCFHRIVPRKDLDAFVSELMERCGLDPAFRSRFPHQFSGGQRQRVAIARALALSPDLIVCDEAVAALDVSVQAQVINLFMDLREQLGLTYLFISHDLGVVQHISDRVLVMYLGRIVEEAPATRLFERPRHPYSQALLTEVKRLHDRRLDTPPVRGEIPSALRPPPGCAFHPRCPVATDRCRTEVPVLRRMKDGTKVACHLADD